MRSFHLACPYTSLAVCHCRLYVSAPPRYARNPFKQTPSRKNDALRRAQLLELICSIRAPPNGRQTPPASLVRAMYHRAMNGRLPGRQRILEQHAELATMQNLDDEGAYVLAIDQYQDAKDELRRAEEQLQRATAAFEAGSIDVTDGIGVDHTMDVHLGANNANNTNGNTHINDEGDDVDDEEDSDDGDDLDHDDEGDPDHDDDDNNNGHGHKENGVRMEDDNPSDGADDSDAEDYSVHTHSTLPSRARYQNAATVDFSRVISDDGASVDGASSHRRRPSRRTKH